MRILVQDKWDTWICEGDTAALDLLNQRIGEGFWYDNWDDGKDKHQWEDRAKAISVAGSNDDAWKFLEERSDHEYEDVRLI